MKKIILIISLILIASGLFGQTQLKKGLIVGDAADTVIISKITIDGDNLIKIYQGTIQRYMYGQLKIADTASMLTKYARKASPTFTGTVTLPSGTSIGDVSSTEIGYVNGVTSAIQTQIDGKITKGIIDSVNSIGTDAQFFSTAGDTLLPYIPYEDRITSNPYFKGQTNTDSLLIHGAYAERTTVNKLKIGGNNSPGTSATPAGDVAIVLDAYMGTDTTMSANHIARIRSQNMMSSHYGSNLIFDTHTSLQDTYGGSTYLLPAMILDYNGSVITPFRNTGTVSNSGGITHAQLARLMYYDEAAATDITKDPQIVCNEAYARDGTIITIVGSSDTNTLKLDDGAGLQLAGGVSFTLGVGDTITLVFSSTLNLWVELSRSDN